MKSSIPEYINKTCRKCNKSRLMKVVEVKKKTFSVLTRAQRRKLQWGNRGNQGTYSKSVAKSDKKSKKKHLLLCCQECGKKQPFSRPRLKDLQIKKVERLK